jgi:hypothetical protein
VQPISRGREPALTTGQPAFIWERPGISLSEPMAGRGAARGPVNSACGAATPGSSDESLEFACHPVTPWGQVVGRRMSESVEKPRVVGGEPPATCSMTPSLRCPPAPPPPLGSLSPLRRRSRGAPPDERGPRTPPGPTARACLSDPNPRRASPGSAWAAGRTGVRGSQLAGGPAPREGRPATPAKPVADRPRLWSPSFLSASAHRIVPPRAGAGPEVPRSPLTVVIAPW